MAISYFVLYTKNIIIFIDLQFPMQQIEYRAVQELTHSKSENDLRKIAMNNKISFGTEDSSGNQPMCGKKLSIIPQSSSLYKKETLSVRLYKNQPFQDKNCIQKQEDGRREQCKMGLRPSIIQFETNKKNICNKIIRSDINRVSKLLGPQKIQIIEEDPVICSTDLYIKNQSGWKNRQMFSLTTKKFAEVSISEVIKIKIKATQPMLGYHIMRITQNNQVLHEYGIRESCLRHWFANSAWVCLLDRNIETSINQHFKEDYCGWILKKSEILRNWQQRFVTISVFEGLKSAHQQDQEPTLQIPATSEVWTRFQTVNRNGNNFLIIKLWHNFLKRQFAVPIANCISWLKAFATLIQQKNN